MEHIFFKGIITMPDVDVSEAIVRAAQPIKKGPTITGIIEDEIKSNLESVWPTALMVVEASLTPHNDPTPSSEPSDRG